MVRCVASRDRFSLDNFRLHGCSNASTLYKLMEETLWTALVQRMVSSRCQLSTDMPKLDIS